MTDLLDDLPPEAPLVPEVIPPKKLSKDERQQRDIRKIEDDLLLENMAIMRDAAKMRDIDPSAKELEIPMEWIAEVGMAEAQKRLRIALAAWQKGGDAPVGLALAKAVMVGIIKARATEKGRPVHLNIGAVAVNMPMPMFKVVEVDE